MRCEYSDGLTIDYTGSLTVHSGKNIKGYHAREEYIPEELKYELNRAAGSGSCGELRRIALSVATDCGKVCIN